MTELPFVTIIIPVWNSPDLIAKCLDAIRRQTYPADRFETLVIDNGSTDGTAAVVGRYAFATLLSEPKPGSYNARNNGLRHARGDYFAFTDADCVPEPGWLAAAVAAARANPTAGICAGRITLFRTGGAGSEACEKYERLFAFDQRRNVAAGACFTANWLSPRRMFEELGDFDGRLKSGGDTDMSRRIHKAGYPLIYVPEMVVGHPVRAQYDELAQKRRRIVGGRWVAQKRSFALLQWTLILLREGAQKMKVVFWNSGLPLRDKLQIASVVVALTGTMIAELFRIALGGEPSRA